MEKTAFYVFSDKITEKFAKFCFKFINMITRKGLAAGLNTKSFKIGDEEIAYAAKKEFPRVNFLPKKKTAIQRLLREKIGAQRTQK